MDYRKLAARPKNHVQASKAVEELKRLSRRSGENCRRARSRSAHRDWVSRQNQYQSQQQDYPLWARR